MNFVLELHFGIEHVGAVQPGVSDIRTTQIQILHSKVRTVYGCKWVGRILLGISVARQCTTSNNHDECDQKLFSHEVTSPFFDISVNVFISEKLTFSLTENSIFKGGPKAATLGGAIDSSDYSARFIICTVP
jgi:hypothetical protein